MSEDQELKFEVGKTYKTCDGFAIMYDDQCWMKATGISQIGDTFTVKQIDSVGDAVVGDSYYTVASKGELAKGYVVEVVEPQQGDDLMELVNKFFEELGPNGVGPTSPPKDPCPVPVFQCTMKDLDQVDTEAVTGGSSPTYYRKSLVLPMADNRDIFCEVDLEAGDVIDAWNLNFNMGNIVKSSLRGDNKEGVDNKYALDKIIWFALREELRQGLITHREFWQKAVAVGLAKEI